MAKSIKRSRAARRRSRRARKSRARTMKRGRTRRVMGGMETPPRTPPRIQVPNAPKRPRVSPANLNDGVPQNLEPVFNAEYIASYTTPPQSPNTRSAPTISPAELVYYDVEEEDVPMDL